MYPERFMTKHGLIVVCSLMGALLTACADEDAQTPPAAAPTYVTNTTYNNNITYAYGASPAVSSAPAAPTSAPVAEVPAPPPPIAAPESSVNLPRITALNGAPRDMTSTGIAECDAYLTRVETCSRTLMPDSDAAQRGLERIDMSLDMTRRAWRHAAETGAERPELARMCKDARAIYESSVESYCPS